MIKRLVVFGTAVALLGAVGGVTYASSHADATYDGTLNFTLVTVNANFNLGQFSPPDNNPGDVLVFEGDVMNARQTKQVGRQDGFCVFTQVEGGDDHFELCQLSFSLAKGQIELQGTFDQTANPNTFAIVGGTGIYRTAHGVVVADFADGFVFHFRLVLSD